MCGGQPSVDDSAQKQMMKESKIARRDEEKRQKRITKGTAEIDRAFGEFGDGFYDDYNQTQLDYYLPQLDQQFSDAQDELTYALARAGTLKSSIAGNKQADLNTAYGTQKAAVVADATGATTDLKNTVQNQKSDLVTLLNATGDATAAANNALAQSRVLKSTVPAYNPLGDIFAGFASGVGNYYANQQNQQILNAYYSPGSASGSGSARTVGA